MKSLEELESIVRNRICSVCSDRTVEGECGRTEPQSCALFRLFPEVAQTIVSVSSDDIRDYVEALRKNVCSVCTGQYADGTCNHRTEVRCALDAYLILVIDAIEEATGKKFDRSVLPPPGASATVRLAAQ